MTEDEAASRSIRSIPNIEDLYGHATAVLRCFKFLEMAIDRFSHLARNTVRKFTNDIPIITLEETKSLKLREVLEASSSSGLAGTFRTEDLGGFGFFILDQKMTDFILGTLLGERGEMPLHDQGRPYTTIEKSLIERVLKTLIQDLEIAFKPEAPTHFVWGHLEETVKYLQIDKEDAQVFFVRMQLAFKSTNGYLSVVIPFSTVKPIYRPVVVERPDPEPDPLWEEALLDHFQKTHFSLDVVFDHTHEKLVDVMNWQKGSTIFLLQSPEEKVTVSCEGTFLFRAHLGHSGKRLAVNIEEVIE